MGPQASGEDDLPALLRRSHLEPVYDHDVRFEHRNAEDVHKEALAAALAEHVRIREAALAAVQLEEERWENEQRRLFNLQEEERVRIQTERAREECRLRDIENRKKQIPIPAPRAKTPPPRAPSPPPPPAAHRSSLETCTSGDTSSNRTETSSASASGDIKAACTLESLPGCSPEARTTRGPGSGAACSAGARETSNTSLGLYTPSYRALC